MPATDHYVAHKPSLVAEAYSGGAAVTTHDTNELSNVSSMIYVGGTGNLKVTLVSGDVVTLNSVPAGAQLKLRAKIIWQNGTTATNIVAFW